MRFKFTFVFILLAVCLNTARLYAQDGQNAQTQTQTLRSLWKGINLDEVLADPSIATEGKKFYLYNVGTGCFIIEGGNWGMEGRLFHEDFGRPMYLKVFNGVPRIQNGLYILSGITEEYSNYKRTFGCNVPGVSKSNGQWIRDYNKYSFTVLMDVYQIDLAPWTYQRVESEGDTYTYYLWETMNKMPTMPGYTSEGSGTTNYYLGAAYGECHTPPASSEHPDYKGDGKLVYLDDDRSCWTTENILESSLNQRAYTVNGEQVTLGELYQWRLISEEEFEKVLNEMIVNVNPSISSLIPDRDFCRNSDVFDESWKPKENADHSYASESNEGRLGYTWYHGKMQDGYYNDEPWDKPLRLKGQFGDPKEGIGMKNSKYGFLSFEGVGRTYTELVVPRPGWYEIQCYGFAAGDHDAYLFAKVKGATADDISVGGAYGGEAKADLKRLGSDPNNTFNVDITKKNTEEEFLRVGNELTRNGDAYKTVLWICVTKDQFDSDDESKKTLQIGIGKDGATKSQPGEEKGSWTYFYDTDWVCVDDFRGTYMGEAPVFFYEDEESLDYLNIPTIVEEESQEGNPRQHNQVFVDEEGHYSGAACLERTFKKDQWNSFSFPLPLTGQQMRLAFGKDATLAKIHGIGTWSQNPNVIDFETINLNTTSRVVEPGQFYLLMPKASPTKSKDPRDVESEYYKMGQLFFSVDADKASDQFPFLDLTTWKQNTQSFVVYPNESASDGCYATVNYVQTPGYSSFAIGSDGIYTGSDDNGIFAPKGAYVVSQGTIYHINKDTRLKGFRGWIVLDHDINGQSNWGIAFNGVLDTGENLDFIEEMQSFLPTQIADGTAVYDISGRQVGVISDKLPKGLYLVNGKKFIVK